MIAWALFLVRVMAGSWRRRFARRGVSSQPVVALTLISLVASFVFSVSVVSLAAPAQASPPAGTGGAFRPLQGRLADTRIGTGGYSAPLPANTNRQYQVTGMVGVPSTGVSAVLLSVTALAPAALGDMSITPNPKTPGSTGSIVLSWGAGETVSNTGLVAMGSNGQILVNSSATTGMLIDVQGYFLTGNGTPGPGGYVPVTPTRIVNTATGLGAPLAKIATGSSLTIQAAGVAGVPVSASGVFVTITAIHQASGGWIEPYPTGTTPPVGSLNFPGTGATDFGVSVHVNASGQASILVGGGGPTDILVDVVGYFSATNGASGAAGSFNPLQRRVLDTRTGTSLAANSVTTIQVAGINGIPAAGSGVSAVALTFTAIDSQTPGSWGYLLAWASDQVEPPSSSSLWYNYAITRSTTAVVAVAADGTIKVRNTGTVPVDVVLDSQGWFASSTALPQASDTACTQSGTRAGTQPLTHQLSDSTTMAVNPTNGNLALGGSLLHLRGVGQDLNIGWRYNGLNDTRPTLNTGLYENALQPWTDGSFTYVAPDGGCYQFTKSVSGWSTPAGINATLTSPVAGTIALRFNPSGIINTYVRTGGVYQLTKSADKNASGANLISYTYTAGKLASITDTQARVVTFAYTDAGNPTQPSSITDTSLSRTIALAYGGPSGALSKITDATGAVSTLGYDATGLISLSNNGNQTSFGYDTSSRATSWTYGAGSLAASSWAAAYASSIKTTITDGNGHGAIYTIAGATTTVISDPLGHLISSKWDGFDNLQTRTDAMGNLTSNSYGNATNINNMLAGIISPAGTLNGIGASKSLTFPTATTGGLGDYQPTGSIDPQGNTSIIGYDANTHQANSVTSKSAAGVAIGGTKTSTIQGDTAGTTCGAKTGEVCTTSNGNTNTTVYGYDASGNPTSITPPAPLGARALTYDAAGQVLTSSDGRGNTAHYGYDGNGRTTQVSQALTGCPVATCVSYTYDGAGNLTSRTSPTGVTSYTYDGLNRPTTKTQAGVLVATATYDPASNLTSYTDTTGTTGYGYDSANRLVSLAEPGGSCPAYPTPVSTPNATACTGFGYDSDNRRTTTSSPNGQTSTTVYDGAGRVSSITAKTAGGTTTLASRSYLHQSAPLTLADQSLVASMSDQSGKTTYGYDGMNRLTSSTTAAGIISSWAYDNDGNRTSATKTGAATVYSAYNGADQLCWTSTVSAGVCASPPSGATTYSYDASGNQTSDQIGATTLANSFNVFNQLTDTLIGGTTTLTSTYADTSNTERLTAGATSFINGTLGVTSQTTSGASINYIRDPYGNLVAMHTAGQSYYYTTDKQGSVIALTDSTQALAASYTYDPWGNTTSSIGALATTNPWTYAGSYTDTATGYLKLGARYYNPTTGRFTQPDPSGQEANTYNYAACNPVNSTDPSGLNGSCGVGLGILGIFYGDFEGTAIALGVIGGETAGEIAVASAFGPAGLIFGGVVLVGAIAVASTC
jgi:RHS repeat-associated protein